MASIVPKLSASKEGMQRKKRVPGCKCYSNPCRDNFLCREGWGRVLGEHLIPSDQLLEG